MPVSIAKISTVDERQLFVMLNHDETKNDIQLQILNLKNKEAFDAFVTDFKLRTLAAELRMPFSEYMKETVAAFSGADEKQQYTFELYNIGDDQYLKWKKTIEESQIKLNFGEILLAKKEFDSVTAEILVLASTELNNSYQKTQELTETVEKREGEIKEAQELLEEAVKAKEEIEKEFFSKFALVLNTKKRKIRELYEIIEDLKSKGKGKRKIEPVAARIDDFDDVLNQPGPSKRPSKSSADHSLLLSDDDIEKEPPAKQYKPRLRQKVVLLAPRAKSKPSHTITKPLSSSDEDVDDLLDAF